MNRYASRIGWVFWRLIPANPILVRVVQGASRRVRHLWIRLAYLVFLLLVVLAFIVGGSDSAGGTTLADLAKNASTMFMWASITQLFLMCFLSPVFTAGAITQERDAQTFNILMSTPLSNAQIVLGSLMSRLYFVLTLLLAGLPIFLMMMVYGGVTAGQILQSFAIAGSTAVLTGSLAICISMIRVGTRRTILSFYVMIGFYLLAVYALGKWRVTWIDEGPVNVHGKRLSWLAAFHPFLSLDVALNRISAPPVELLGERGAIARYFLAYPHHAYVLITLGLSVLLTVTAMFFVRQPKEGESGFLAGLLDRFTGRDIGQRRRKPRSVWNNPVAWREARSRASAATRGFLDIALIGGGLAAAIWLLLNHMETANVPETRWWLAALLMIELGLILLVATNTAATAITKDKESQTMDLLLTTPLTSRYLVWGKLRGLVMFTIPLIAVPTISVLLFGVHALLTGTGKAVVPIETVLEVALLMTVYSTAACMFGLTISMHSRRTVRSVMLSVGILVLICLILTLVVGSIIEGGGIGGAFAAAFTPFTALGTLANPAALFDSPQELAKNYAGLRIGFATGSAAAAIVYVLGIAAAYKSMVRNFDMIMRKQSAQN